MNLFFKKILFVGPLLLITFSVRAQVTWSPWVENGFRQALTETGPETLKKSRMEQWALKPRFAEAYMVTAGLVSDSRELGYSSGLSFWVNTSEASAKPLARVLKKAFRTSLFIADFENSLLAVTNVMMGWLSKQSGQTVQRDERVFRIDPTQAKAVALGFSKMKVNWSDWGMKAKLVKGELAGKEQAYWELTGEAKYLSRASTLLLSLDNKSKDYELLLFVAKGPEQNAEMKIEDLSQLRAVKKKTSVRLFLPAFQAQTWVEKDWSANWPKSENRLGPDSKKVENFFQWLSWDQSAPAEAPLEAESAGDGKARVVRANQPYFWALEHLPTKQRLFQGTFPQPVEKPPSEPEN